MGAQNTAKTKGQNVTLSDFKTYYKTGIIKTVWYPNKKALLMQ